MALLNIFLFIKLQYSDQQYSNENVKMNKIFELIIKYLNPQQNIQNNKNQMPRQNTKRLMLIGQKKVGKTSIISYLLKKRQFQSEYYPTMGVQAGILSYEFDVVNQNQNQNRFKQQNQEKSANQGRQFAVVQLWDTAGKHELHQYVCEKFYNDIDGFVIVTDLGDSNTLKSVNYWTEKIKRVKGSQYGYKIFVVANKSDVPRQEFSTSQFQKMYPNMKLYGKFSLKQKVQGNQRSTVEKVFEAIIRQLYQNKLPQINPNIESSSVKSNCTCQVM